MAEDLRSRFTEALKAAMLAKDAAKTSTLRMIMAKLKDTDIAARPSGVDKVPEEQIVAIVRESEREGVTVAQVAKKHGITETTLFRWRKRFGGLTPSQATELRQLQHENARLKKVVAQLTLDVDILKEVNAKKW